MAKIVSVVLATYNGEKYLEQQLDSLLKQTYTEFKCYIHDDGSTDNTVTIIKAYASKYPDRFIVLDGKPSGGAKNNFFYLLENVESDYYLFSDQDDYWEENKIEEMVNLAFTKDNGKPLFLFSDLEVVDASLNQISASFMKFTGRERKDYSPTYLLHRNYAPGCSSLINKHLRDLMLVRWKDKCIEMHDWWGMIVASCYGEIWFCDRQLVKYRQHSSNVLGARKYGRLSVLFHLSTKRHDTKTSVERAIALADIVLSLESDIDSERKKELEDISRLKNKGKLFRTAFYAKNMRHFPIYSLVFFLLFS